MVEYFRLIDRSSWTDFAHRWDRQDTMIAIAVIVGLFVVGRFVVGRK